MRMTRHHSIAFESAERGTSRLAASDDFVLLLPFLPFAFRIFQSGVVHMALRGIGNCRFAGHDGRFDVMLDPASHLVAEVRPHAGSATSESDCLDAEGCILLPGLVHSHIHLDKW